MRSEESVPISIKSLTRFKGFGLVYPEFPFKVGDRIGQVYLEEVIPIEFEEVEEFDVINNRGSYGSTGK